MAAGDQWMTEDLQRLQDQQRPAVTFDRIGRTLNAIVGTQIANRQETRYIPREQGDVQVNEVLTAAGEWARDNCDAEDEESDSFEDMLTCGMGWTETRMDYDSDPEGQIVIERIDPMEMYWDPSARKKNLSDAKWVMHVKVMSLEDFQAEWPDADPEAVSAPWEGAEDDISTRTHVYPQDAYNEPQSTGGPKGKRMVRVAHMQWAVKKDSYRVGKKAEKVSRDAFEKLRAKLDERKIGYVKQADVEWMRAFVAGGEVLEEGACPYPEGPTIRCMTYKRDRNNGTWYGIVKAMVDPQRFGNKFFSQILSILNKGSKGGVIAEKDAFEDHREVEAKWARDDALIWAKPSTLAQGKVMPKPLVEIPAGMDKLMAFSLDAVHEVTGVNLELLGFANREQAGVLESQRKQAGLTIIAPLFDAMRRYRKEQGRVLLHFIQTYIADGRLIRIMGQQGQEQYVPLAVQNETAVYDVIVDEAPTSPNMKERVYGALVEMLPAMAKLGLPLPPELLDYAPIPSSLAQKWKEQVEKGAQLPPEVQKEMSRLAEENKKLKDKKEETQAQIQLKQAETAADAQLSQQELDLKKQEAREELAIKKWQAEQEFSLQQRKVQAELLIKAAQGSGENGRPVDMGRLREIFQEPPRRRRITVNRNQEGFIESADVMDGPG